VKKILTQITRLLELQKILQDRYVPEFAKNEQKAAELQHALKEVFQKKGVAVCAQLSLDPPTAELYKNWLLQDLNEEYLYKISALVEQHRVITTHFRVLLYPQFRALLEQAVQGLLLQQPYTLDRINRSIVPDFQHELNAIAQLYPQNVIDKAKASAPDGYQKFLAEVFKA
jgi:hypothetical protein